MPTDTPVEHESTSGLVDPLVGRVLAGRFRILECIAQGGMGRIYRAEQAPLGRTVAVKVLHLDARNEDDGNFRERFFREASVCARLSHPNTVRIFDYGTEDGVYFIAMEFLEGRTLNDLIRKEGPLAPTRAITIARQICRSLEQAHSQGVIHRDLKPANVFLAAHGPDEFVKVLDFGLVKAIDSKSQVTRAGNILGSPAYMSPEQVLGTPVTARSDLYALGVILYACLTRALPFKRDNPLAILNAQAHAEPPTFARAAPDVDVPESLEWIVMRCLEKQPAERFESMAELERALRLADQELNGSVSDISWSLTDGRLDVPEGLGDSSSQISRSLRPSPPVSDSVQDAPSSPTLNVETGTPEAPKEGHPLRDFVIAAVVVLLIGLGGMTALAAGFYVALSGDAEVQPETVPAAISTDVPAKVDNAQPVVEDEAVGKSEEPQETAPEVFEEPPVVTPKRASTGGTTRKTSSRKSTPKTSPKTSTKGSSKTTTSEVAKAPSKSSGTTASDEPDTKSTSDEPVEPDGTEQAEDDWGSVKPASDLKDPWAD